MSGPALAAVALLLPYASVNAEDAVLTLALALPAVAAVAVDWVLRGAGRAAGRRVRRRRRARGTR